MPELLHELRQAETMLAAYVTVKLTPAQRAALLSLVIDLVGRHSAGRSSAPFKDSKLLAYLNQGFYQMAATEFMTYCYVFGRVDKRAWNKRNCEQNLFRSGRLVLEH